MNTPIIKISDDQNEITHESGVVTVFVESRIVSCSNCCYLNDDGNCLQEDIDCSTGYYTLKQPTT